MSSLAKQQVLLSVFVYLALVQLGFACSDHKLSKIEEHLKATESSNDVAKNVKLLREYVKQVEKEGSLFNSKQSKLEFIGSLIAINDISEFACDEKEFELLRSLDTLVYGKAPAIEKEPGECLRRIKTIFNAVLEKHVKQCASKHQQQVLEAMKHAVYYSQPLKDLLVNLFMEGKFGADDTVSSLYKLTDLFQLKSMSDDDGIRALDSFVGYEMHRIYGTFKKSNQKFSLARWEGLLGELLIKRCDDLVKQTREIAQIATLDILFQDQSEMGFNQADGRIRIKRRSDRSSYKGREKYWRVIVADHLCKIAIKEQKQLAKKLSKQFVFSDYTPQKISPTDVFNYMFGQKSSE